MQRKQPLNVEKTPAQILAAERLRVARDKLEAELALQLRAVGETQPVREYRFHAERGWRFDFAWPVLMVAVEVDGGTAYGRSRHSRGDGYDRDCEKFNEAALAGWQVLRVTGTHLKNGQALAWVQRALALSRRVLDRSMPGSVRDWFELGDRVRQTSTGRVGKVTRAETEAALWFEVDGTRERVKEWEHD